MRTLLLHQPVRSLRAEADMLDALAEVADLRNWDGRIRADGYDAVVLFLPFRYVKALPALDWYGFDGVRAMLDHDACQNYWAVDEQALYLGSWPEVVRRHQVDLLIVSGQLLAQRFTEDGIGAAWLPKAYQPSRFHDLGGHRDGFAHYGSPRRSRAAMLHHVGRAGIDVEQVSVPYPALPAALNRFEGCLICNGSGRVPFSRLGRALNRLRPFVKVGPSMEPMLKNFEAAGCGCAVFTDHHPDLKTLGFHDRDTVITYETFDELVDKLRHYESDPEALRRIGRAGAALVRSQHTWRHRAEELVRILKQHHDRGRSG